MYVFTDKIMLEMVNFLKKLWYFFQVPKESKLLFGFDPKLGEKLLYPNVFIKNVYMFPGIPHFLHKSFDILKKSLFKPEHKFYTKEVYLNVSEHSIVEALNKTLAEYQDVVFGSYPEMFNEYGFPYDCNVM